MSYTDPELIESLFKGPKINNVHLESLICGIKQQFNPILSQIQYEVMAEWRLKGR